MEKYNKQPDDNSASFAAEAVRKKISRIHTSEPNALKELAEAEAETRLSIHQQYIRDLKSSGKNLAQIQTDWHKYYQELPEDQKQQVWDEFYASQSELKTKAAPKKLRDTRSTKDLKKTLHHHVSAGGKLSAKHHVQSILFGLGLGLIVIVIFLFGFFNEVIIAPFIQPSRANADTPLIVNSASVAATQQPEVIIPKINVQIPVYYGSNTTDEAAIENDLEKGVVHYPTTSVPGQNGNAAFFGHSSNNIFNKGKYKFAFVLLRTLVPDDVFYLTYNGKVYVYKVISKRVVDPSEVSVLNAQEGQTATATLITCDPPGTSLKRLVIVGQQVSPDPNSNSVATTQPSQISSSSAQLPGNGPTLLNNFVSSTSGKLVIGAILVACMIVVIRWINKPKRNIN